MAQESDPQCEPIRGIEAIEYFNGTGQIACRFGVTEAFRRALRRLTEVAQRTWKIATLFEMKCEHGRDFARATGVGLLQPLAQAPVRLRALAGCEIMVDDVLIENVTEGV